MDTNEQFAGICVWHCSFLPLFQDFLESVTKNQCCMRNAESVFESAVEKYIRQFWLIELSGQLSGMFHSRQ